MFWKMDDETSSYDSKRHELDVKEARKKFEMQLKKAHMKYCFVENKSVDWNAIINDRSSPSEKKDPALGWLVDFFMSKKLSKKDDRCTMNLNEILEFIKTLDPQKEDILNEALTEAKEKKDSVSKTESMKDANKMKNFQALDPNQQELKKEDTDEINENKEEKRKAMYEKFLKQNIRKKSSFSGFDSSSEGVVQQTSDDDLENTKRRNNLVKKYKYDRVVTSPTLLSDDRLSTLIDELSSLMSFPQNNEPKKQHPIKKLKAAENLVKDEKNEGFFMKLLDGYLLKDPEISENNSIDQEDLLTLSEEKVWKVTEKNSFTTPTEEKVEQRKSMKPILKKMAKKADKEKEHTMKTRRQLKDSSNCLNMASNCSLYSAIVEEEVMKLIGENPNLIFSDIEDEERLMQGGRKSELKMRRSYTETDEDRELIDANFMIEEEERKIREKREQLQQLEELHKEVVARSDSITNLSLSASKSSASYTTIEDQLEEMISHLLQDSEEVKEGENKIRTTLRRGWCRKNKSNNHYKTKSKNNNNNNSNNNNSSNNNKNKNNHHHHYFVLLSLKV